MRVEREPKARKCDSCGVVGDTVLVAFDSAKSFRVCVVKCGPKLRDLVRLYEKAEPGDAVTWDPSYNPNPWGTWP